MPPETAISHRPAMGAVVVLVMAAVVTVGLVGWFRSPNRERAGAGRQNDLASERAAQIVAAEEWMLAMTPWLNQLGAATKTPPFTASGFGAAFGDVVAINTGTNPWTIEAGTWPSWGISRSTRTPPGDDLSDTPAAGAALWDTGDDVTALSGGNFAFVDGAFLDGDRRIFAGTVAFSAAAENKAGSPAAFRSLQRVEWVYAKPGGRNPSIYVFDPEDWKVRSWTTRHAIVTTAETALFNDVTKNVIFDPVAIPLALRSRHTEYLSELYESGALELKKPYGQYFTQDAVGQHPAVSVVDIDGDGDDDLYVCVRWGRNFLLRNRGDGTFEEDAESVGLDIDGLSSCAIFADFDNDGDADLLLGRTLERSRYYMNEGGRFVDRTSSHIDGPLPYLASSASAADFNGDGLLDLYLCTYGFARKHPRAQVARDFLPEHDANEVLSKFIKAPGADHYIDLPGTPNTLLVNAGGGTFRRADQSSAVACWRESLQATWADYDGDGDPDLYVANDFAPDNFFRNDGGERFVDVTAEAGGIHMAGFGMGASFGDYDNDGRLDLYVSNMYSKAGLRITGRMGNKDDRFRRSAEGNLLFRNRDGTTFDYLSAPGGTMDTVAKAGWAWGGQFLDIDNDSFLDLYVPNGYFTPPPKFASDEDL